MRIPMGIVSAANFDAHLINVGLIEAGILTLTRGVLAKRKITYRDAIVSNDAPVDANAQGELKYLVVYESTVTHKKFQLELPVADSSILPEGSDYVNLLTDGVDFVEAFEIGARTPDVSNDPVKVLSIKVVGRNR